MRKWLLVVGGVLMVASAGWARRGPQITAYEIFADFSTTKNPSRGWSYGTMKAGSTAFRPSNRPYQWEVTGGQVDRWEGAEGSGFGAHIIRNPNAADASAADAVWPAKRVSLHPGPNGERAVVRWTAPVGGPSVIQVKFTALDKKGTSTDVHVLLSGTALFDGRIAGTTDSKSFSKNVSLKAGDVVDLVVGDGGNGWANDTTGVEAAITQIGAGGNPAEGVTVEPGQLVGNPPKPRE